MLTATRNNGHEVRFHNRSQHARWEKRQAVLGRVLGIGAAICGVIVVFYVGLMIAEWRDGRLPDGTVQSSFGSSPQAVSPPDGASITIAGERR